MMKKLFYWLLLIFASVCALNFVTAEDSDFYYEIDSNTQLKWSNETLELSDVVVEDAIEPEDGIFSNLFDFFKLSGKQYDTWTGKALNYVKWIINILLWLVWFISVILIIFAFYLIFVTKSEEAVGKARKILTWVAIALIILWASWLITSFLFYLYGQITTV